MLGSAPPAPILVPRQGSSLEGNQRKYSWHFLQLMHRDELKDETLKAAAKPALFSAYCSTMSARFTGNIPNETAGFRQMTTSAILYPREYGQLFVVS